MRNEDLQRSKIMYIWIHIFVMAFHTRTFRMRWKEKISKQMKNPFVIHAAIQKNTLVFSICNILMFGKMFMNFPWILFSTYGSENSTSQSTWEQLFF